MVENSSVPLVSSTFAEASAYRSSQSRLATNDIYLAALLLSKDYSLVKVIRNARRRVSFIFAGDGLEELREAYRRGRVRSFGESLTRVRQLMNEQQRSVAHGPLQPGGDREPQEWR